MSTVLFWLRGFVVASWSSIICRCRCICRHMYESIYSFFSIGSLPDSKIHEANMRPTWVLSAQDGPHVGPMNLAIGAGTLCQYLDDTGQYQTTTKHNKTRITGKILVIYCTRGKHKRKLATKCYCLWWNFCSFSSLTGCTNIHDIDRLTHAICSSQASNWERPRSYLIARLA